MPDVMVLPANVKQAATWILDPTTKQAFIHRQDGLHE